MKKYFKYHLYEERTFIIITCVLSLVAMLVYLLSGNKFTYTVSGMTRPGDPKIYLFGVLAIVLANIIPIKAFSFKMRKVSVDEYYQLPIKRTKLFLVHYLVGIIELVAPLVLALGVILIVYAANSVIFVIWPLFVYFLINIVFAIAVFTVLSFAYTRGNTIADGVVFMILYSFIICIIMCIPDMMLGNRDNTSLYNIIGAGDAYIYIIEAPTVWYASLFEKLMCKETIDSTTAFFTTATYIAPIVILVIASLAGVLFFKLNGKEPAENVGQISRSKFGYICLIPLCGGVCGAMLIKLSPFLAFPVLLYSFVGYVVFNRGVKFTKPQYISMAVELAIIGICLGISYTTGAFIV